MITVRPDVFTKVEYEADVLAALAREALEGVPGLPNDLDVAVEVDEDAATTRFAIVSMDPVAFRIDGGSVENLRDPRRMGELATKITFTRLFLELFDRRSALFGAPPLDASMTQAHRVAWDANLYGRTAQLGVRLHKPRFRYDFRNRHGFSDHGDGVFDELWSAGEISWTRVVQLSDSAAAGPR